MLRLLVIALIALLASSPPSRAQSVENAPGFALRPGDTIDILVLEDSSLNRQILIRPDGRISLPIAGSVVAAGRTPEELESEISRALARDFVQPPSVTVSLARLGDAPLDEARGPDGRLGVFVIGQVSRQGRINARPPVDLLRAIALAGGLNAFAASKRIQVRRRSDDAETLLLFNFDNVESGLVPAGSFDLLDGDVVVVPQRGLFE